MSLTNNEIAVLAQRVERGETGAAVELRRLLDGSLGPIVRRALRGGTSLLDQRIRDTARRAGVAQVTGSVSARIVGRLRAGADSVVAEKQTVVV